MVDVLVEKMISHCSGERDGWESEARKGRKMGDVVLMLMFLGREEWKRKVGDVWWKEKKKPSKL